MSKKTYTKLEKIVFSVFVIAILLRTYIFIHQTIAFSISAAQVFLFATDVILYLFMLLALYRQNKAATATLYLVIKTYDGLYHPIQGLKAINERPTDNWANTASNITYLICGICLFLAVMLIIVHEFAKSKTILSSIVNVVTLGAVIASAINIIFTSIDISISGINIFFLFEPIFQTILFLGVYLVTPIAHPNVRGKQFY